MSTALVVINSISIKIVLQVNFYSTHTAWIDITRSRNGIANTDIWAPARSAPLSCARPASARSSPMPRPCSHWGRSATSSTARSRLLGAQIAIQNVTRLISVRFIQNVYRYFLYVIQFFNAESMTNPPKGPKSHLSVIRRKILAMKYRQKRTYSTPFRIFSCFNFSNTFIIAALRNVCNDSELFYHSIRRMP